MTVLLVVLGLFFVYLIVSQYLPQSSRIKEGATGKAASSATSDADIKAIIAQKNIKAEPAGLKLTKSYQNDPTLQPNPNTLTYFALTMANFYKVTSVKKSSPGLYSCLLKGTTNPIYVSDTRLYNDLGTNVPKKASGSSGAKPAKSGSSGAKSASGSSGAKPASSGAKPASGSSGAAKPASSGKAKLTKTIVTMTFKSQ